MLFLKGDMHMNFKVEAKLEKDVYSEKKKTTYNRVIINFGDFEKMVVLNKLELMNLESKLVKRDE